MWFQFLLCSYYLQNWVWTAFYPPLTVCLFWSSARYLADNHGWDAGDARKIWCFGPNMVSLKVFQYFFWCHTFFFFLFVLFCSINSSYSSKLLPSHIWCQSTNTEQGSRNFFDSYVTARNLFFWFGLVRRGNSHRDRTQTWNNRRIKESMHHIFLIACTRNAKKMQNRQTKQIQFIIFAVQWILRCSSVKALWGFFSNKFYLYLKLKLLLNFDICLVPS